MEDQGDKPNPKVTSRRWTFTLNNPTPAEVEGVRAGAVDEKVVYLIFGKEVGEETHTPHLQGYVVLKQPQRFAAVRKLLCERLYLSVARGTTEQNRVYCSKDGEFETFGVAPLNEEDRDRVTGAMERQRWEDARVAAENREFDRIDADIYVRCFNNLHGIAAATTRPIAALPHTTRHLWYYGEPGTGKSLKARTENPGAFIKGPDRWWDGYAGQDVVIIEDLDHYNVGLTRDLKIWGDIYDFPAEKKGSTLGRIRPKLIIVTSNYSIDDIWGDKPVCCEALKRRFQQVKFWGDCPPMPPKAVAPVMTIVAPPPPLTRANSLDWFQTDDELFAMLEDPFPPM